MRAVIIITLLLWAVAVSAQIDTRTRTLHPDFATLMVYPEDNPLDMPVVRLGSDDRIIVTFDELSDEPRLMRFRIRHCNADWTFSNLNQAEYADGFNESRIDDYAHSQATMQGYVNYKFTFPADDLKPLLSGNYLVEIYDEDDPGHTLAQARIMVTEQLVDISSEATTRTDYDYNGSHQQLAVRVNPRDLRLRDPFGDLRLVVMQNGCFDNARAVARPLRQDTDGSLVYEHTPELTWPAGNEYRRFETVSTDYPGLHTSALAVDGDRYLFRLEYDTPMCDRPYQYDSTQQGAFVIRSDNSAEGEDDTEADYVNVLFTLDMPRQYDTEIYLDGRFTGNLDLPRYLMRYDEANGLYYNVQYLKQGSYNYRYRTTGDNPNMIDGNKYRTDNRYDIFVYYRRQGDRYDRLSGVSRLRMSDGTKGR